MNAGLKKGFDVLCLEVMPYGSLLMNLPLTDSYDCREIYRESEDILGSAVATVSPYGVLKSKHLVLAASGYKTAQWVAYMLKMRVFDKVSGGNSKGTRRLYPSSRQRSRFVRAAVLSRLTHSVVQRFVKLSLRSEVHHISDDAVGTVCNSCICFRHFSDDNRFRYTDA